jgi:hypothetical protein
VGTLPPPAGWVGRPAGWLQQCKVKILASACPYAAHSWIPVQCLFSDPVVAADGFTYERAAIHDYLYRCACAAMRTMQSGWWQWLAGLALLVGSVPRSVYPGSLHATLWNAVGLLGPQIAFCPALPAFQAWHQVRPSAP